MSKVLLAVLLLALFVFGGRLLDRRIQDFGRLRRVPPRRIQTVRKGFNMLVVIGCVLGISFVLGLGYHQLYIFLSSILAVIGVALFAQWSILSHISAGLIIFFAFPYRVGDRIRVVDPDEDIAGEIIEIATFHVLIRRDDDSTITYPNSALLQRAVIKLTGSQSHLQGPDTEASVSIVQVDN